MTDFTTISTAEIINQLLASKQIPYHTLLITFDPFKHQMGNLCARGHDYQNTGQSVRALVHNNCMICMRLNALAWKRKYPNRLRALTERTESREERQKKQKLAREKRFAVPENLLKRIMAGAKKRALTKGLDFDLSATYILKLWEKQKGKCHFLNVPLQLYGVARHPLKPSLDRVDSAKGYTKDNVVWASSFANRAKGEIGRDEFRRILKLLNLPLTS